MAEGIARRRPAPARQPEDREWKRLQRRQLLGGLALATALGVAMARAWPGPAEPRVAAAGDVFVAGPDAPPIVRMSAADRGRVVTTRRHVTAFRARLADLAARCGGLAEDEAAALVERTRSAVRGTGRPLSYARTIAELSFAVEVAGDRDCDAAARVIVSSTEGSPWPEEAREPSSQR